jgi:hypothetical protein
VGPTCSQAPLFFLAEKSTAILPVGRLGCAVRATSARSGAIHAGRNAHLVAKAVAIASDQFQKANDNRRF